MRKIIDAGAVFGESERVKKLRFSRVLEHRLCVFGQHLDIRSRDNNGKLRFFRKLGEQVQLFFFNAQNANIERILRFKGEPLLFIRSSYQRIAEDSPKPRKRIAFGFDLFKQLGAAAR